MNRWRVALCVALVLLVAGVAVYADYPGVTYNYWVDFEGAALGVAPTTATLAASTHGTGETWIISNPINSLTVVSNAQSGISGATGTRGLQYNDPTGAAAYVGMYLPSTQTSVSMGMWYCTSNQSASGYAYQEGPHFFGFYNNAFGPIWRLSDERNSVDNTREIRISPTGPDSTSLRRIPVSDNTCYWVSTKLVKGSSITFNLYDTSLNLLGSVTTADTFNQSVDLVWLGNEVKTSSNLAYSDRMDDLIIDYTTAAFPLLPKLAPPAINAVNTFAGNAQHTSAYVPTSQDLGLVKWTASVNSNTGGATSRYASPLITAANTVIVPTQISGGAFQLNAYTGSTGAPLYALSTDYIAPTSTITPVYQPVLVNGATGTRLYYAGAGGSILYIANPDSATPGTPVRQVFYTTLSDYQARAASFNSTVFINTPITADANGNIFFGFRIQGTAPSPLSAQDGFARIDANGNGTFVLAGTAAADSTVLHDAQNSAPTVSNDNATVYFAAKSASTDNYAYLLGLDSSTLSTKYRVFLTDPRNGNAAGVSDNSTASPVVGPDNDVYFGVSANPDNGSRGFLLHYSSDLTVTKTPGAFGWDNTPAIVSNSMVSSYTGSSTYLLLSNYNDYAGQVDGQGVNKVALLDPNSTETDSHSSSNGLSVMREVLNIAGPTPDAANQNSTFPSAVLPWLGNAFAVNASTKTVLLPSSDGNLYRWNVSTNSISQFLNLGAAGSQQNVPTVIGADGATYTISGSTLVAVQGLSGVGVNVTSSNPDERTLAAGQNVTFTATVTNGGGSGTPTGTVTFTDKVSTVVSGSLNTTTTTLGSASLNASGIATLTPVTLTTGNHFITANYGGNGTFPAGSGGMVQVVHNGASATTVTATPNPSVIGQSVTFNVTVASVPSGGAAPTGQVTLTQGSTPLAQLTLSNGVANFSTSALPAGSSAITASYAGDSSYSASTGNVTAVVQNPTLTSLTSSSNPATQGQSVTFTATVTSSGGTPVGSVTFTDGATVLASNVAVNTSGIATFSTSSLSTGSHTIGASFTGSTGWQNSTASTLTEQINQATFTTSTSVTSTPNPSNSGQSVTFTATVTSSGGTPAGTVTFSEGATVLASNVTVNASGQASFSTSTLSVGSHTITASFTGSGGFGSSTGNAAPQVVNSVAASFPGIPYDAWVDFEGLTTGAAPTVSALASSTHGAAGTWTVTNANNVLSSVTAAQDTLSGAPGTKGLQYNSTSSDPKNFVEWAMPSTHTQVSVGMYYCTSNQSSSAFAYAEGPHFLGFDSNSFGDLWRLSDERNSVDNTREIRVSPTGPANAVMIPVKDSTCYWLTMRLVKGANVDFSVYDTNLNLIQHVTTPDTFNQNIDAIWLGSNLANGISSTFYNIRFDDLIVDYTNATFPLLPVLGSVNPTVAIASSASPVNVGQSVTFTDTVTPGSATGTASFSDGSTVLASGVAVTGGQATFTTSALAAGTHTISTTFTPASGTPSTATLTQSVVAPVATSTALTSSSNPALPGQSVTFTATVTSSSGTPVGSVTFTDGATTLASGVALNSGVATFATSSLATGSHSIVASFTGATGWQNSASSTLTQTINQSSFTTSTAVTSTPNPSTSGLGVTFTATVTSTGGTPAGSVTFAEGATVLASNVAVNASGQAAFSTSTLSVGSHTITASFTGSGGFGSSTGTAAPQVVNSASSSGFPGIPYDMWTDFEGLNTGSAPTTTGLIGSTHGAAGTWTVTNSSGSLSAATAGQDTITGASGTKGLAYNSTAGDPPDRLQWAMPSTHTQVSFGLYYCTSNESTSAFAYAEGPHFIGFDNNSFGDLWRLSDERNSVDNSREIRVSPTGPANAVMIPVADNTCYWLTMRLVKGANVDFSVYDTSLNLVQHVTTPDTFAQNIDSIWIGNNLANGIPSTFYNMRFDDLVVDYTNATFPLLPKQTLATTTAVTSSANPSGPGQSLTFTATISSTGGTPTGTVTFTDGATTLASNVAVSAGKATFTTSSLSVATHTITASFTGTGNFGNSSGSVSQSVSGATTTAVTSSANPSNSGQSITLTATITGAGSSVPTGTVKFTDGTTTLASAATVTAGKATFTTSSLAVGSHSITAAYTPSGSFTASSGTLTQTVQIATSNSVASSANPSNPGASVTFTATVTSSNGIPQGTMAFKDGATTLASGVSVSTTTGKATFSTSSLASGTHSITAVFTGNAGWLASTSSALNQLVNASTTTTVSATPNPQTTGLSVTITATVTSSVGTPTGTVTFKVGSTTLASNVALSSGKATITSTALPTGTDTITATYNGATGFLTSTGTTTETMAADTSPPTTPTNVAAVSGPTTGRITVSWTASTDNVGVQNYQVFRASSSNGTFSQVATVTTTSYTDNLILSGLTRFYYVVAVDTTNHTSGNSAHVSATSK